MWLEQRISCGLANRVLSPSPLVPTHIKYRRPVTLRSGTIRAASRGRMVLPIKLAADLRCTLRTCPIREGEPSVVSLHVSLQVLDVGLTHTALELKFLK